MNPYDESNRDTLVQLAVIVGYLASVAFCLLGIWLGLGNTYGDWTPSFDGVIFAAMIAAIPFAVPFTLNFVAIPLLFKEQNRAIGIALLASACLLALGIGFVAVRMGNF